MKMEMETGMKMEMEKTQKRNAEREAICFILQALQKESKNEGEHQIYKKMRIF